MKEEGRRSFRTTEVLLICAAIVFAATNITQTALCAGTDALACEFGAVGDRRHPGLETLRITGPVLLAGAWLVLVFTQPWRWWVRLLATVPSVLTLVDLVRSLRPTIVVPAGDETESMVAMLGISAGIEVSAVVALLAILTTPSRGGVHLPRVILLLIASTSAGYLHTFIGGAIAGAVGASPWQESFTGGFVTAASIAIPTLASMALGLAHRRAGDEHPSPRPVRVARPTGGFLAAELLLIAASGVVVWVTHLGWAPCAGSMFESTQFDPTPHDANFSPACYEAMDHGDGFPISSWLESPLQQTVNGLNAIALLLLGLAWVLLVRSRGVQGVRALLASLPGVLNLWLAAVATAGFIWPPAETPGTAGIAILLMDIAGLVGVLVLLSGTAASRSAGSGIRIVLLAFAVTAPSLSRILTDYLVMSTFSEANWDSPPGTGFLTAFSIALFAILSMIVGVIARLAGLRPARLVTQPAAIG